MALLHHRISVLDLSKTYVVSFLDNLAGMPFFIDVLTGRSSQPFSLPLKHY
jgi:hypothetical protein